MQLTSHDLKSKILSLFKCFNFLIDSIWCRDFLFQRSREDLRREETSCDTNKVFADVELQSGESIQIRKKTSSWRGRKKEMQNKTNYYPWEPFRSTRLKKMTTKLLPGFCCCCWSCWYHHSCCQCCSCCCPCCCGCCQCYCFCCGGGGCCCQCCCCSCCCCSCCLLL